MPFASCNPINPRTNLWNFREKNLRIGDFEKRCFFESAILNFFFLKKKIQNGWLKKGHFSKSPILNIFLWKFYGSVLGLVDWCKGQRCGSTYMAMRLFDISSKTGKKCNFCVFRPFYNFRPYIVTWLYFFVNILGV